jgi:hypothetical protein
MKSSRQNRSPAQIVPTLTAVPQASMRNLGRPLKVHAIQWTIGEGCGLSLLESWFVATPHTREIRGGGENMNPIR